MATTLKATENDRKKSTVKQAANAKATAGQKDDSKSASRKKAGPHEITSASRLEMIEVAAYYIAEKRGFDQQNMDHWLAAEKEIDRQLNA